MRQQKYEQALRDILEQVNLLNARTVVAANPRAPEAPALGVMMQMVPGLAGQMQEASIVYEKLIGTPEGKRLGVAVAETVPMEDV